MPLTTKFRKFASLRWCDRLLFLEAVVWLALARLLILTVPFSVLARWLCRKADHGTPDDAMIRRIRGAIVTAAHNVPWQAVCLPQAIAAKTMLGRRHYGSTLVLGVGIGAGRKLNAHAWVVCGGTIVIGGEAAKDVTQLAEFR